MARHRGPSPDETWEYFASRQGGQGPTIVFEGVKFDREELLVSFNVDTGRERIDGKYFHPRFKKVSENRRVNALYLLLDGAIGEDGVERWLGDIALEPKKPKEAVPFSQFLTALAELQGKATGEQFAIMHAETDDGPVFMTCNRALKRIDHLLHTMHVAVDLAILDQNEHGLTTPADAEKLNVLEDELSAALGGLAVYFGRETKRGHRVFHWYVPEDSAAQAIIERWTKQHAERDPRVEWVRDSRWAFVKRYV